MSMWTELIIQSKKFIEPSGHHILQEIIESLKPFDEALNNGDLSAAESGYLMAAKSVTDLLPHITNKKMFEMWSAAGNGCASLAKVLANGGDLNDVAKFEKQLALNFFSTMN